MSAIPTCGGLIGPNLRLTPVERNFTGTLYLAELDGVPLGYCSSADIVDRGGVLPEVTVNGQRVEFRTLTLAREL